MSSDQVPAQFLARHSWFKLDIPENLIFEEPGIYENYQIDRRRFATSLGILALVLPFAGCDAASDVLGHTLSPYRYQLTVEVDTPEGLKTGSSVIEVREAIAGKLSLSNPGGLSTRVRGEAVTVDLGKRGLMFALLRSGDGDVNWPAGATYSGLPTPPHMGQTDPFVEMHDAMLGRRDLIVLPRYQPHHPGDPLPPAKLHPDDPPPAAYPMLVRFADLRDPKSVQRVDADDLAASFGSGVRLRRITVQLTDAAVSTGLIKTLSWLNHLERYRSDPANVFSSTLAPEIGSLRRLN